jgi:hypothetical protein
MPLTGDFFVNLAIAGILLAAAVIGLFAPHEHLRKKFDDPIRRETRAIIKTLREHGVANPKNTHASQTAHLNAYRRIMREAVITMRHEKVDRLHIMDRSHAMAMLVYDDAKLQRVEFLSHLITNRGIIDISEARAILKDAQVVSSPLQSGVL